MTPSDDPHHHPVLGGARVGVGEEAVMVERVNGWPGEHGVPENAGVDGWHWIEDGNYAGNRWSVPWQWDAKNRRWHSPSIGLWPPAQMNGGLVYHGSCFTPAQVAERERAVRAADVGSVATYQVGVNDWMLVCFGSAITRDRAERSHRFLEEALELVQASGCTASEAHQLVDYVFGRPIGEVHQEVGGVMVCLAALCTTHGLDMAEAGETELQRVWTKVEKIRAKHAAKPQFSPLPGPTLPTPPGAA